VKEEQGHSSKCYLKSDRSEFVMPLFSVDAMMKTFAEQQAQIEELKEQVAQLEILLEHQNQTNLALELLTVLNDYPDKLENPIIASIAFH
jgi:hypothetical protein